MPSTLYGPHRHPSSSSGADLARWCEPPRRSLQKRKPMPDRRNPAHQSSRLLLTCHRTIIASPSTMPRTTASLRLRNRARPVDLRCRSEFRAAIEVRPLRGNKVRHSKSTETSTSKAAHMCEDPEYTSPVVPTISTKVRGSPSTSRRLFRGGPPVTSTSTRRCTRACSPPGTLPRRRTMTRDVQPESAHICVIIRLP